MSETHRQPFGQPAPGRASSTPQPEEAPKENRTLVLLGMVAALVVVAAGAWFFLLSGDETPDPGAGPTAAAPPAAQPTEPATEDSEEALPETYDGAAGRDPFKPLVFEEPEPDIAEVVTVPGTTVPGTTVPGATTDATTGGVPLTATTPTPQPADGSTATPTEGRPKGAPTPVAFTLTSVAEDGSSAEVEVDGQTYLVGVNEDFAGSFRSLRLLDGCGTFQYGDERFDLCQGDTQHLA